MTAWLVLVDTCAAPCQAAGQQLIGSAQIDRGAPAVGFWPEHLSTNSILLTGAAVFSELGA
jgi:hypothetical protein